MPTRGDRLAALPSEEIDRLLRTAVTAPNDVTDDDPGRFMARLLVELADRDEDVLLNTYLAVDPRRPPKFAVRVSHPGRARHDELLEGLKASRALRAASGRAGIPDTVVEVIAHEVEAGDRTVLRADPSSPLAFVGDAHGDAHADATVPDEPAPSASSPAPELHDAVHHAVREAVAGLSVHLDADDLKGVVRQAVDRAIDERRLGPAETMPTAREVAAELVERLRSDDELLERLAPPDPPVPPTAEEVATRVVGRLPAVPTAQQVAERVVDALPGNPPAPSAAEIAAAVARVLPADPSGQELLDKLGNVGIEIDSDALAEALRPELARGWSSVEQQVTTRLIEAPSAAEVDELRTDARELRELLRSSRLSFTALHEELTSSARRSREQIDELAAQLTEDLHRWNRTIDDRLSKLAASGGTVAQTERLRRLLAKLDDVLEQFAARADPPTGTVTPPS